MEQKEELAKVLSEMGKCIQKEDVKVGLPYDTEFTNDAAYLIGLWNQQSKVVADLKHHIEELDYDIQARSPWGDLVVDSTTVFEPDKPVTRYWTAPKDCLESNHDLWSNSYNISVISTGDYLSYFTTTTARDKDIMMEGAEEAKVCPSPVSTLIMLQTRAKDTLKHELIKQEDCAIAHYLEVEAMLGLSDTLKHQKRKIIVDKIKGIFNK